MLMRCQWENLNLVIPHPASGTDLSNVTPNRDEVLEINLTPHQLRLQPDSINWVWFRRLTEFDKPLKSAKDIYLERLTRIYEYYDPLQVGKVAAILSDHDGKEDLLFLRLAAKYGPEPTKEQWRRKQMIAGFQPQNAGGAGAVGGPMSAGGGAFGQPTPGPGADSFLIASLMGRTGSHLLMMTYYKKWRAWRRRKHDAYRICGFLTGNFESILRKEYFSKFKHYHLTKKMKRQLQASTQMAYKSESLVGDLATENMFLKGEVKKLQAQVTVLDSANSKRLETLFSSSEAAVKQIKALTRENEQKELLINQLEGKLMNVGNMMLKAQEERDDKLRLAAENQISLERAVEELTAKNSILEDAMQKMRIELQSHRPKTPPKSCLHCEHYTDIAREADALKNLHKKLAEKVEDLNSDKRKLGDLVSALQQQVQQLQQALTEAQQREKQLTATLIEGGGNPQGDQKGRNQGSPPGGARGPSQSQGLHSGGSGFGTPAEMSRESTQNMSFLSRSVTDNATFSGPPGFQGGNSFAAGYGTEGSTYNPDVVYDASGVGRAGSSISTSNPPKANVSLEGFFAREEQLSREKIKMFIDRQSHNRVPSTNLMTPRASGVTSLQVQQALAEAARLDRHPVAMLNAAAAFEMPMASRPATEPTHSRFTPTGSTATPSQMMSSIFSFKR